MTMHDDKKDPMWERIGDTYNVPPETPRAEIWSAISARIGDAGDDSDVIDITSRRAMGGRSITPRADRTAGWAVAAAAVLVLGIGIGRMTAPEGVLNQPMAASEAITGEASLTLAAQEHLGQSESLLTIVRADARDGRVDPATAGWANGLLTQTRLLMDAQDGRDQTVGELLLDLELILIQIAGVAETGSMDEAQARTELELALRSLEDGEVLSRIQAVLPAGMAGA